MKRMSEFYEFGPGPNHCFWGTTWRPGRLLWMSGGKHTSEHIYNAAHIVKFLWRWPYHGDVTCT